MSVIISSGSFISHDTVAKWLNGYNAPLSLGAPVLVGLDLNRISIPVHQRHNLVKTNLNLAESIALRSCGLFTILLVKLLENSARNASRYHSEFGVGKVTPGNVKCGVEVGESRSGASSDQR